MSKKQKQHQSIVPGHGVGAKVVNKDINYALRVWKKKLKESKTLVALKDGREYIKPSVKKRKQKIAAVYMQKIKDLYSY